MNHQSGVHAEAVAAGGFTMDNKHVTLALREMLADLPLVDREERFLLFVSKMDMLKAEDNPRSEVDKSHCSRENSPQDNTRRNRTAEEKQKNLPLAAFLALAALALIEFIIIVVLLVSGGDKAIKPVAPDDSHNAIIDSDPGYVDSAKGTAADLEPQTDLKWHTAFVFVDHYK